MSFDPTNTSDTTLPPHVRATLEANDQGRLTFGQWFRMFRSALWLVPLIIGGTLLVTLLLSTFYLRARDTLSQPIFLIGISAVCALLYNGTLLLDLLVGKVVHTQGYRSSKQVWRGRSRQTIYFIGSQRVKQNPYMVTMRLFERSLDDRSNFVVYYLPISKTIVAFFPTDENWAPSDGGGGDRHDYISAELVLAAVSLALPILYVILSRVVLKN
jgi:hypothetical protein